MKYDLPKQEIARYLGMPQITPDIEALVDRCILDIQSIIKPRFLSRYMDKCAALALLPGTAIREHLKKSSGVLFVCATLGLEIDRAIARAGINNMPYALILDAVATTALESFCNLECARLKEQYGMITSRFGPGYGDLPLECQKSILNILNAERRIGVTLTSKHILTPQKSITAVVGVGQGGLAGCIHCNLKAQCTYRKKEDNS